VGGGVSGVCRRGLWMRINMLLCNISHCIVAYLCITLFYSIVIVY
jgi:hypothetical protein